MEMALHRRGDRERKETTEVHNELKAAIAAVDQQASAAVIQLDQKVADAERQIAALDTTVKEVLRLCERAEVPAGRAQSAARTACRRQRDEWMTFRRAQGEGCSAGPLSPLSHSWPGPACMVYSSRAGGCFPLSQQAKAHDVPGLGGPICGRC